MKLTLALLQGWARKDHLRTIYAHIRRKIKMVTFKPFFSLLLGGVKSKIIIDKMTFLGTRKS